MSLTPKLNLSRFKRSAQGIREFAILIEQADPAQRQKILEQADKQDKDFVYKVMKKVVFFEELVFLDEGILAEILSKVSAKVLAYALRDREPAFATTILKNLSHRERKIYEEELDKMGDKMNSSLVAGGQKHILKTARGLEDQNKFVFELVTCPRFDQKKKRAPAEPEPSDSEPAGALSLKIAK